MKPNKVTTQQVNKYIAETLGITQNQEFCVEGEKCCPLHFDENYETRDSDNNHYKVNLINLELTLLPRFINRKHIHDKLSELAHGFKPDWNDTNSYKYHIYYNHRTKTVSIDSLAYTQYCPYMIYFKNHQDAQRAVDYFTPEEWDIYFG